MHRQVKHVSEGRRFATDLLKPLNEGKFSPKIERLLEEIAEVNRLVVLHREASDQWIAPSAEMRRILQLQKSIKSILQAYPMTPMLRIGPDGWSHTFDRPARTKEVFQRDYVVLQYIHEACELRFLWKLAWCEYAKCEKWFLRRVRGQRFNSASCREYAFKSTAEWKAYRAKKAREYYRLHRD